MREKITENPRLIEEWDWEKNGELGLNPEEITAGSNKKAWWVCKEGHKWSAIIANRTKGRKCPYCSNKIVIAGINDLQTKFPEIAAEWHPTKNEKLTPDMVLHGSDKKVWWQCNKCGHEWSTKIYHRTKKNGTGCPECAKKKQGRLYRKTMSIKNNFAINYPEIAAQWHPVLNGDLKPNQISSGSGEKVWWQCKYGHEWQATINSRVQGCNCPYCNLQTSFPEQTIYYYVKQFFPDTINCYTDFGFELDIYIPSIKTAIEYDGVRFHKEKERKDKNKNQKCKSNNINLIRIREPGLCIYDECICLIRNDSRSNDSLADVIKKLFAILNVKKYNINIDRDQAQILEMYRYSVASNSLAILNPEIAAEWHPTKNGNLKPENFANCSGKKVWWKCSKCLYEWKSSIATRTSGSNCPCCVNLVVVSGKNDLQTKFPEIAAQWHPTKNKTLKPNMVVPGSGKRVWWICDECGYEWEATICSRSNGRGCPCCANKVVVAGINDLQTKFPDIAKEWHPTKNGNFKPNMIVYGSHKKVWWLCLKCSHEWEATIDNRTHGRGCPECAKKKREQSRQKTIAIKKSNSLKTA